MEIPVPYKGNQPFIFISYAHRNSSRIYPIITRMQEDGFRVWYDDGINPGSEWDDNIAEHVQACSYFIAFLSEEYLASENCRDELNYARSLGKNRLLIYLTDVTLPAGMDMRLNRLQAVYWSRFRTMEEALEKLYEAEGLDLCRGEKTTVELIDVPVPPPEEKPKKSKTPKPRKEKKEKAPQKEKEQNPPRKKKKRGRLLLVPLAAVLLIVGITLFGGRDKPSSAQPQSTGALPEQTPAAEQSSGRNWSAGGDMGCLLYGSYTLIGTELSDFAKSAVYVTRELEDGSYEMSERPVKAEVDPQYPGLIQLGFCDKFSQIYYLYGAYTLVDGILKVEPCEEPVPEGFLTEFFQAQPLKESLEYGFALENGEYLISRDSGKLRLGNETQVETGEIVLSGQASSPEEAYEDILYLDFAYAGGETSVCQVGFTDGGHTDDSYVSNMWENIAVMTIEWKNEQRPYNGRMESFQVRGYLHVGFYSTYPYGFVLDDGENLYFYQSPIG